jgi:peptidoglycan/LPS O-acetylase OafA/YrhL
VLLVILSHASLDKMNMAPGLNFSGMGRVGVFLFFVLSAYLLDRQIIVGFVNGRANKRFWANYFLRRFLRIYPLYILALFIFYGSYKMGFQSPIHDLPTIWRHLTLQEGLGIFWSIAVEFKYYFLSPLIMAFCNYALKWDLKKVTIFILVLIGISIFIQAKYLHSNIGDESAHENNISLITFLPIFLTGTLLSIYEVVLEKTRNLKVFKSSKLEYAGLICFGLILLSTPALFNSLFLSNGQKYFLADSAFFFPYAIVWSVVLMAAKYGSLHVLKRFFEITIMRFLGIVSFSMYLFHLIVLKIVEQPKLHIPHSLQVYVFLIGASIMSFFSYVLIERQLQKIRIKY